MHAWSVSCRILFFYFFFLFLSLFSSYLIFHLIRSHLIISYLGSIHRTFIIKPSPHDMMSYLMLSSPYDVSPHVRLPYASLCCAQCLSLIVSCHVLVLCLPDHII